MLDPTEKRTLERMESRLAMPRWKFLLFYGLSFGVILALFTAGIDLATKRKTPDEIMGKSIWFNLGLIPLTGFLFAKIIHWRIVKKWLELKNKESASR